MNPIEDSFRRLLASHGAFRILGVRPRTGGEETFVVENNTSVIGSFATWPDALSFWRDEILRSQRQGVLRT